MLRRRRRKRNSQRQPLQRRRWGVKLKRSRLLKVRQIFEGKGIIVAFGVVVFLSAIYSAFFTPLFTVVDAVVQTDYQDINVERVRDVVLHQVEGKNALLLPVQQLEQDIYDVFPDVSSMTCRRHFFDRSVQCEAVGYELVAVIKHQNNKYYINENGVVIAFDNRKLGLPLFDLILNPVFAEIESRPAERLVVEEIAAVNTNEISAPLGPVDPASISASILDDPEPETEAPFPQPSILSFVQPFEDPPLVPLEINEERKVFEVSVGKKILDPDELTLILEALEELENVLERKVINAQYVQVAGELSLTSRPQVDPDADISEDSSEEDTETVLAVNEAADHEFTILMDLRRNLEDQFTKLKKSKEVINFATIERIDLSIDGEKVFYR